MRSDHSALQENPDHSLWANTSGSSLSASSGASTRQISTQQPQPSFSDTNAIRERQRSSQARTVATWADPVSTQIVSRRISSPPLAPLPPARRLRLGHGLALRLGNQVAVLRRLLVLLVRR